MECGILAAAMRDFYKDLEFVAAAGGTAGREPKPGCAYLTARGEMIAAPDDGAIIVELPGVLVVDVADWFVD